MGVIRSQYLHARSVLPPEIRVVEISYDDAWARDCGPTCIVNKNKDVRCIDWEFNAWGGLNGGLYFPWDLDNLVARKIAEIEGLDLYKSTLILEGGSIHVDGNGTLLTTEECLLNPNRNPKLSKQDLEKELSDYLNIQKIIWLKRGVHLDETSGHVDNLCCFIREGMVALTWTEDKVDPQYEISAEAYDTLMGSTDAKGNRLEVVKIHQPNPQYITEEESSGIDEIEGSYPRKTGDRLAASYINFYLCNGGVIVPTFRDPNDSQALAILQDLYPDRKVIGIFARELLLGGGNIHCITQQIPI
jgi:agmatine deiminase